LISVCYTRFEYKILLVFLFCDVSYWLFSNKDLWYEFYFNLIFKWNLTYISRKILEVINWLCQLPSYVC
jgi:hypothetical protein